MPKNHLQKHWNFAEMKIISQYYQRPLPLASRYMHPDKDTIPLFSHYKH